MLDVPAADTAAFFRGLDCVAALHATFSLSMLWQSTLVIAAIAVLDALFLRRGRAGLRYAVWLLVLAKFLLPVNLPGPLPTLAALLRPASPASVPGDAVTAVAPETPVKPIRRPPRRDEASRREPVVAATELHRASAPFSWTGGLFLLWSGGVIVLAVGFARELRRVRRLVRAARPAGPEWNATLIEAARRVGTDRFDRIEVRVTDELTSPALCGWLRGTILIPAPLATRLEPDQRRIVLAHELAHWRRRDPQVNALQSLLQIAYFYQPLLWIANGLIRRIREHAVDEETVAAIGVAVERYAETLVDVADPSRGRPRLAWSVVGVASRGALADRVQRLLSRPIPRSPRLGRPQLAAILLLAAVLLPLGRFTRRASAADPIAQSPRSVSTPEAAPMSGPRQEEKPGDPPPGTILPAGAVMPAGAVPPAGAVFPADAATGAALQKAIEAIQALSPEEQAALVQPADNEICGLVFDFDATRPVPGAVVRLVQCERRAETVANERGMFRITVQEDDLFEGEAVLTVRAEGFPPEALMRSPGAGAGEGLCIVPLSRRTGLKGVVTNAAGEPVFDARVRASWTTEAAMGFPLEFETRSEPDGTYRLPLPASTIGVRDEDAEIDVQAFAAGQGIGRVAVREVTFGDTLLPIQLEPAIQFEARIVDSETGRPVEGFGLYSPVRPFFAARSDAAGRLVLKDRPPGRLQVMCGGGEVMKSPEGCAECEGFVGFEPGPYGRWWSAEATLEMMREERPEGEGWQGNDGVLWFDLRGGMAPVTIFVERSVTISGRITDPEGRPVAGAMVSPVKTGKGNSLGGDTSEDRKTDADGRYRLTVPASKNAACNLMVHDGAYEEWRTWANGVSRPLRTKPGEAVENLDFPLTRPGRVRGRVTRNGAPAAGVMVKAQAADGRENTYYDPKVLTAADGTFELKHLRPGGHRLTTGRFYSDKLEGTAIEIVAGETVTGIELDARESE